MKRSSAVSHIDAKNTKLHLACLTEQENNSQQSILPILKSSPQDAFTPNSSLELPLHYACLNQNISYKIFQSIYELNPDAVYNFTKDRCLPIHYYCRIGAPNIKILHLLLDAYPDSVYEQAECLVLFDSISESNCYSKFIRLSCERLLLSSSTSLSSPHAASILSLHIIKIQSDPATFWNSSMWRIFDQKKVLPEDYEVGWSPLHLAVISCCANFERVQLLIDGETLKSSLGRTALDCARIVMNCEEEVEKYSFIDEIDQVNMKNVAHVLKKI